MSRPQTSFTYGRTTVLMELNPKPPRNFTESKSFAPGMDSVGDAYAYDEGAPISRTEQLEFPYISSTNLNQLLDFIETTLGGAKRVMTWLDRGVSRTARYVGCSYQQVTTSKWRVSLSLEVLS